MGSVLGDDDDDDDDDDGDIGVWTCWALFIKVNNLVIITIQ